jgi:hypothetical protein
MDVTNAFNIDHVASNTYATMNRSLRYNRQCIFCLFSESEPLLVDGSMRRCLKCKKEFKGTPFAKPVSNYTLSTAFLKPNTTDN